MNLTAREMTGMGLGSRLLFALASCLQLCLGYIGPAPPANVPRSFAFDGEKLSVK